MSRRSSPWGGFRGLLAKVRAAFDSGRIDDELIRAVWEWRGSYPLVPLPPVQLSYALNPPLELPPSLSRLAGLRIPERVRAVRVRGPLLTLELVGESGEVVEVPFTTPGCAAAVFAVWLALKRRGIDFLADLVEAVERLAGELEGMARAAGPVRALMEVVMA
ncbi:MAG: hypothetical protein QXT37_11280 [Thermofilaceae archaeon]